MSRQKYSKAIAYTVFVSLKKNVYREATLHEVGKLHKKTVKKFLQNPDFCTIGQNFKKKLTQFKTVYLKGLRL